MHIRNISTSTYNRAQFILPSYPIPETRNVLLTGSLNVAEMEKTKRKKRKKREKPKPLTKVPIKRKKSVGGGTRKCKRERQSNPLFASIVESQAVVAKYHVL